ncbi:MAG: hypothetical protein KJO98_01005, partial [Rhodothermia bacterium]|nr:hypothetical protein [Rhodothermia bacterium]
VAPVLTATPLATILFIAAQLNPYTTSGDQVPTSPAELFDYLRSGEYKHFAHEPEIHPSLGPHSDVKVFANQKLAASLEAGADEHPQHAAAVKELYRDDTMLGWAVMVKTEPNSDQGNGWYWYEVLSTTDGSRLAANGNGVPLCVGCHTIGQDYVRISPSSLDFQKAK